MCLICGSGFHGFALTERPAVTLYGRWSDDTDGRAVASLASEVAAAAATGDGWRSPVVVLTVATAEGVRLFVGAAAPAAGADSIDSDEATYAACWHAGHAADVIGRYSALLEWIETEALRRGNDAIRQREEYPADGPFDGTAVRLMVSVEGARDVF